MVRPLTFRYKQDRGGCHIAAARNFFTQVEKDCGLEPKFWDARLRPSDRRASHKLYQPPP
jgi:hypothetical protein